MKKEDKYDRTITRTKRFADAKISDSRIPQFETPEGLFAGDEK